MNHSVYYLLKKCLCVILLCPPMSLFISCPLDMPIWSLGPCTYSISHPPLCLHFPFAFTPTQPHVFTHPSRLTLHPPNHMCAHLHALRVSDPPVCPPTLVPCAPISFTANPNRPAAANASSTSTTKLACEYQEYKLIRPRKEAKLHKRAHVNLKSNKPRVDARPDLAGCTNLNISHDAPNSWALSTTSKRLGI